MPLTRKALEMAIVRCAERWPDRVGPRGWGTVGNACLIGQCSLDLAPGFLSPSAAWFALIGDNETGSAAMLGMKAASMNDSGSPWAEIARRLDLVPGEAPPEPVVAQESVATELLQAQETMATEV